MSNWVEFESNLVVFDFFNYLSNRVEFLQTPCGNLALHVVNFVASQSNFAYATNLLYRGSVNYTCHRFTFAAQSAQGMNICVKQVKLLLLASSSGWWLGDNQNQRTPLDLFNHEVIYLLQFVDACLAKLKRWEKEEENLNSSKMYYVCNSICKLCRILHEI